VHAQQDIGLRIEQLPTTVEVEVIDGDRLTASGIQHLLVAVGGADDGSVLPEQDIAHRVSAIAAGRFDHGAIDDHQLDIVSAGGSRKLSR